jgi:hypothetical protein
MAVHQEDLGPSDSFSGPLAGGADFADHDIAQRFAMPEYAWERLPVSSRHHVRQMVRRSQGQRRARLVAILFALLLLLAIIAGVAFYVYGWHLPFTLGS